MAHAIKERDCIPSEVAAYINGGEAHDDLISRVIARKELENQCVLKYTSALIEDGISTALADLADVSITAYTLSLTVETRHKDRYPACTNYGGSFETASFGHKGRKFISYIDDT